MEFMEKCENLLGSSNSFLVLKGQIRNIQRKCKESEFYYIADIRVPRVANLENVYQTSFNIFNVCFDTKFVSKKSITDDIMLTLKDNEIIINLAINSSVKSYKANDGRVFKNNNVSFYVLDYKLVSTIPVPSVSNVINL